MKKTLLILLGCSVTFAALAAETDLVQRANALYESGDTEQAKSLYTSAAEQGSSEANFRLAYQYVLPDEQRIAHFKLAAEQGHEAALEHYLDEVFFRAGSIRLSDPQSALAVFQQAKQLNPNISLYDEESKVQVLTYATQVPNRDVDDFFATYSVKDEDGEWPFYDVWQLAEQASVKGSVFGKPDPELVFWLITRGGNVPAELSYAVKDYYRHWQNDEVVKFDICQYVTSKSGASFCAQREESN